MPTPRSGRPVTLAAVLGLGLLASPGPARAQVDPAAPSSDPPAALAAPRLERAALVRLVLERNPSAEAARQAWRAASERRAQVGALDDPMVEYALAPRSIGSVEPPFGYEIRASQRLPWPGKLGLRGDVADAEARMLAGGYATVRAELAVEASRMFDEYGALASALSLNRDHARLVEELATAARARYEAGRAPQQDPLQAEVEAAHVEHRAMMLAADSAIVAARLNGLLHRRPDAPLPPPAEEAPADAPHDPAALPPLEDQIEEARARRPELAARRAGVAGGEAAVRLAGRMSWPDLAIMSSYSTMWRESEHRWMVGVGLELPIQLGARSAARAEARAERARAEAELAATADQIAVEVQSARRRLVEAAHIAHLYRTRLVPASRAQVEAARYGYETGQHGFASLIDAERSLRDLEIEARFADAALGQRRAELDRALGRTPAGDEGGTP